MKTYFHSPGKHTIQSIVFLCVLVGVVAFFTSPAQAQVQGDVKFWTCSMHPNIKLPGPGLCPICSMELIPVTAETDEAGASETAGLRELKLSAYAQKLAGIQTRPVERRFVTTEVRMVGKVDYDETRISYITAWIPGRIDRVHVNFTGTYVQKGHPMVSLYSPELISAQEELIQAIQSERELRKSRLDVVRTTSRATVDAAREKLRLWGLSPEQIDDIVTRGEPSDHMTILAPISGIVVEKAALEGLYVKTGTRIYTIADLTRVWVMLDAYESDLMNIRTGQQVTFETEAYPGELFSGSIAFIDPFLDPKTRTVNIRVNVPNPGNRLKPEMFVHATVLSTLTETGKPVLSPSAADTPPLVIPASSPLITGKRAVVYVAAADRPGVFEGREIVLGPRAGDYYHVLRGLEEGEQVVTHGNFKIDSSLQIQAKPSMMSPEGGAAATGHEHAHGGMPAAEARDMKMAEMTKMTLPEPFRLQVVSLIEAYDEVSGAMNGKDLSRINETFSILGDRLDAMDSSLLSGHPLMMWKESAMLLGNDATVGRMSTSLKDVTYTYNELSRHIDGLRNTFELEKAAAESVVSGPEPVAAPEPFRMQIGNLLDAYMPLSNALADDDIEKARTALASLERALGDVDMHLLSGQAHQVWMPIASGLQGSLKAMKESADLAGIRNHFLPFSDRLIETVKTFGFHPLKPVYQIRCPMAFGGKGGSWLQNDQNVRNPYFGKGMLRCGDIICSFPAEPK